MINNWSKYGIEVPAGRYGGNYKTYCPKCHDQRHDKRDKSLSCNLATGEFKCHYCDWSGCVAEEEEWEKEQRKQAWFNAHPLKRQKKEYRKPTPKPAAPMEPRALAWFSGRGISQQTLIEMRVTEGLEWMPQKNGEVNTVQFNYYKDGELVNTKFRTGDKCFKLVQGAELLPYNIDGIKGLKTCIITEGEMDALSFYEVGYHNVVSVPNGANANLEYLDDYMEGYFEDKETIYIASDSDTKGEVLKNELLHRFGFDRCKVVEYGDGCKDANEHLQKYGAESLRQCIEAAKEIPIEGTFTVADFEPSLDALYQTGLQRGATIGHGNFDNYCSFSTKMLGVITGIPNHGKSEFLDEMIYRLNLRYGWRWAYFSPENEPMAFHASKLIEKFVGRRFGKDTMPYAEYAYAKRHLDKNFFFINPDDNFQLGNILNKAKSLVRRNGIKGLVIDPYNYVETEQVAGQSKTEYVSQMLSKLKAFAKLNDLLIFLVAHPTKMSKDKEGNYNVPTLYDVSDSAHFNNKADYGISVFRHYAPEEEYVEVNILKVRFKHEGRKGVCYFKYNINNGRYVPYQMGMDVEWDNENHLYRAANDAQQAAMDAARLQFDSPDIDFDDELSPTDEVPY